jgi:hypothetical protein
VEKEKIENKETTQKLIWSDQPFISYCKCKEKLANDQKWEKALGEQKSTVTVYRPPMPCNAITRFPAISAMNNLTIYQSHPFTTYVLDSKLPISVH